MYVYLSIDMYVYICVCIYIIYISICISILCRAVAFIITFSPWMGGNGNPMFNMGFFSCFSHTRLKINYGGYWVKFFLDWIAVKTKQATLDASSILLVPTPVSPLCYQHSSVLPWEGQTSCVKLPVFAAPWHSCCLWGTCLSSCSWALQHVTGLNLWNLFPAG